MLKKSLIIFIISILNSLILLILERSIGIGWDYHPDSVTYATESNEVVDSILSGNFFGFLNNGYYFIAAILMQSVELITSYNMIIFSFTNVMLAKLHWKLTADNRRIISISLLLLLLNPYRLHLSVTLLKDTTIIFLLVATLLQNKFSIAAYLLIFSIRMVSLLYLIIFWLKKYSKKKLTLILLCILIFLLNIGFLSVDLLNTFDEMTSSTMEFRDFDSIPKFNEYGYWGILTRMIIWPLLALTGSFALISPVLPFIMVAIGCLFSIIYNYKLNKKLLPFWGVILVMALFAAIVSSFTTYIRYIYPLIIIYPLLTFIKKNN